MAQIERDARIVVTLDVPCVHDAQACAACARWLSWRERWRHPTQTNSMVLPSVCGWPADISAAFNHWMAHHPLK